MSSSLIALIAGMLDVPPASLSMESGPGVVPAWDSFAHITIVSALEENYGVELTMTEILESKSITDLRKALEAHGASIES